MSCDQETKLLFDWLTGIAGLTSRISGLTSMTLSNNWSMYSLRARFSFFNSVLSSFKSVCVVVVQTVVSTVDPRLSGSKND